MINKLNGGEIMLFVAGRAIAVAKSHKLTLTGKEVDCDNKDAGEWDDTELASLSWEATSDGFVSLKSTATTAKAVTGMSYSALYDIMVAKSSVTVVIGRPSNYASGSDTVLPETTGWLAPSNSTADNIVLSGNGKITSLELTADKGSKATMSIKIKGVGPLSKMDEASGTGA